ncbi:similar to Saccharomyces cerevisiae YJR060W CBF1 Dual function helix-loop-helix protein [Maudiozyma barnettii]|uniref:Similar to Saccharomyces cerevisiae YJR060W CBF1 Dual function helix-loop-helix protein n=1 Tax=Maudiozyma barnettii TaxID=61262 RepID=A0A8H2ZJX9_9SACH|nr:Cbf1p [Kazachstania barnettii]CAB4254647.1 similar to Saccharomyces cerevisiae YJR060W CBF1 Dual function helix-loop-helix protein [Kazachstania barnettii]CAD1782689.1 similar to Saccharomyces cerevisiae YJR060W CBF1 Dual function helix-loop-helix protein [Kazachstania barnettii]
MNSISNRNDEPTEEDIDKRLRDNYDDIEEAHGNLKKQKLSEENVNHNGGNADDDNDDAAAVAASTVAHSEDSNIDSELLGENQHDDDGDHDVSLQHAEDVNNAHHDVEDVASAAVSATYDDLLQNENANHNNVDVSLQEAETALPSHDKLDIPESKIDMAGNDNEEMKMTEEAVADNDNSNSLSGVTTGDDNTSIAIARDIDEARKRLAKRGRKPAPITGTDEWKKQRRDSHKEVERRRRESINHHINNLSLLLPVKETSKAAILARASEYIEKLKETENANIEKWTLQKLLSEQTASQLATAKEKLEEELGHAFKEIDYLKRLLEENHIELPDDMLHDNKNHQSKKDD